MVRGCESGADRVFSVGKRLKSQGSGGSYVDAVNGFTEAMACRIVTSRVLGRISQS